MPPLSMASRSPAALAVVCAATLFACQGVIGDAPQAGPAQIDPSDPRQSLGATGMRRLSQAEIRESLRVLLGSDPGADIELLPADPRTPFDNDYTTQSASAALVEGIKAVADRAAQRLVDDATARAAVVSCAPSSAADSACLRSFIVSFGRKAFRRPLRDAEIDRYMTTQTAAIDAGDFYVAVSMVVRAMIQDPHFLYHIEIGTPVTGATWLRKLSAFELASRLAFLLWGGPPDDALLDAAERGDLATSDGLRAQATRMLGDDRARARIDRFHAMWLGYDTIQLPSELAVPMRAESNALVERVILDEHRPWTDLFRSDETYVDDALATHYGLAPPGSSTPTWVSYGDSGRRGILSHGSFLAAVPKFGDTSPTQRGKLIRTRLLCQEIPPPPPMVNVDMPPESTDSACKWDRYAAHRSVGSCAGCHSQMDPIGFGLERYDETGAYRTTDDGHPECVIEGQGELVGVGTFSGPAELGELLVGSGIVDHCVVTQLYRFVVGRREREETATWIDAMTGEFRAGSLRFDQLILSIVTSPAFQHRVAE